MRPYGVGWQGNLLKHERFEIELFDDERGVRCSPEQAWLPEPLGAVVVIIVMVIGGFGHETRGHACGAQADRSAIIQGRGHITRRNEQPACQGQIRGTHERTAPVFPCQSRW